MDRTEDLKSRLAGALEKRKNEIVQRWCERVVQDVGVSGIHPTELRDALPDYLDRLRDELRRAGNITLEESGSSVWTSIAKEHALARVRLGFDIGQLVHEFIVLRRVIEEIAHEENILDPGRAATLAEVIEAAIGVAVGTYVQARDYELRRAQAANIGFLIHELRNPLSAATMATTRLRLLLTTSEQEHALHVIQRNQDRLRQLIDAVLDTQKLESGKVESRPTPLKLRDLLEEPINSARAAAEQKGLTLEAHFDGDRELEADPVLTRSAVQNLIDNAVKYTEEGRIEVAAEVRPDDIVIHVRDNCPGISPEELRTVFEPFVRGHSKSPGTGLGLAIARRAVQVQGGRLEAESPGERGCHFWITLPRRQPRRPEAA